MRNIPATTLEYAQSHLLAARCSLLAVTTWRREVDRDAAAAVVVALNIAMAGLADGSQAAREASTSVPVLELAVKVIESIPHAQLRAAERALAETVTRLRPYSDTISG